MASPRADDRRDGCGRSYSQLSSTETEDCHSHQGGGGASYARRPTGTDGSSTGDAPGILPEPGPQRSDRCLRRSAGDTPLLAVPSLAGGDGADDTAVAFLVRQTLLEKEEEKRKEEEEVRKVQLAQVKAAKKERKQEMADELVALRRNFLPSERTPSVERRIAQLVSALEASASSKPPTRKRKKRRRKRMRRSSHDPPRLPGWYCW